MSGQEEKEHDEKHNESYIVPALKRGLQILNLFSVQHSVLTVNDFAENLNVTVPSIYRTVITLSELGYLKKIGRSAYELGPMVLSKGFCYLSSRDIVQVAAPYLKELRNETSSSCHLAVREGFEAIYVYEAKSYQRLVVSVPIGSRFSCHSVAIGRALLTGLDAAALSELFSGIALDAYPSSSPKALPQLQKLIRDERKQGFSINSSDFSTAIATPILNYAREVVAAINISAPDTVLNSVSVKESLTSRLIETATEISRELGGDNFSIRES